MQLLEFKLMLNPEQNAAMRHIHGPLLVLAGAGSGKTRVITHKIAHLIRHCGHQPQHIGAITFTNKAAREMKSRAAALLTEIKRSPLITTFHSLGLRMLQQDGELAGLRKGFSILDAEDCRALLRELTRKELELGDRELLQIQARLSAWKNDLIEPAQAHALAEDELTLRDARIYLEYERHLRAYNAVDFDDLITLPVRVLRTQPDCRETWQQRLRYLLVDEYQDTNSAQYELLKLLVGPQGRFTVVGDDDQSIYTWRGARPEHLQQLQQDYPTLTVIKLEQNYRSTRCILQSANQLIANNPHLFSKRLWSDLGQGDPIRVLACRDEEAEAQRIVGELLQHKFQHRTRHGDYAILYRSNHQARPLEKALREQRIPYRITGGPSFFEAAEVKDVLAYLRLLANPDDDAAFLRIINVPRRELGAATIEKLATYARRREVSLLTACDELGLAEFVGERPLQNLREFAAWMTHMQRQAEQETPSACVRRLLQDIEYEAWLLEVCKNRRQAERRMENIQELIDWMNRLQEKWDDEPSLSALLAHFSLVGMLERRDEDAGGDSVQLLTLHSAKGLEFDHVFIAGVEEGILPHRNSLDADNIEEERRLTYVGITRARRSLTLTYASQRRVGGEDVDTEPSRFLLELPADHLQWDKPGAPIDNQTRLARGASQLANLKQMLARE